MSHGFVVIEKIKQLRMDGFTLSEIVTETGISKTTVFDHIHNLPQSQSPEKWNQDFVNLIGHFLFDGQVSRISCAYNNRSIILIQNFIRNMEKYLGVNDYKTYTNSITGVIRVSYHNVEIAHFIKIKIEGLLEYISSAPRGQKISFLKAFFDDEGSINFRNKQRSVRGYQHSLNILELVSGLLNDIGIESKIDKKYFEIGISRKENLLKFQKLINFTPGLRVNGNRSNSVWKKDLEKREILQMAIDSYLQR